MGRKATDISAWNVWPRVIDVFDEDTGERREYMQEDDSEYYEGYRMLMNRCAELSALCRDMFHVIWGEDTSTRTYEMFEQRMRELGLLEDDDE